METLRFLMITSHYPPNHLGGDAVFVEYLSKELISRGHEVHVLTAPGAYSLLRSGPKHSGSQMLKKENVHRFEPAFPRASVLSALIAGTQAKATKKAKKIATDLNPDVVHWHNTKGFIGRPLVLGQARTLYTAHDYYVVCPRSNLLRPDLSTCTGPFNCLSCHLRWRKPPPLWRAGSDRLIEFDSRISLISPSESLARRFQDDGVKVTKVIRNFVPRHSKRTGTPHDNRNVVVYIGMLEHHKGVTTLIKGFARSKNGHGFKLKIVGDGSIKGDLARLIRELDVKDRVELTGFISRDAVNNLRSESAFQIVPSEWPENSPLTAIEALSFGLPIIVSDQGGLPEIACAEDRQFIFAGGDERSLGNCLVNAWKFTDSLGNLRERAKDRYERLFTPEKHISDYMKLINGVDSD